MIVAIDSHMHGDILLKMDRNFPEQYYKNHIGGVIWSYNEKINIIDEYIKYWDYLKDLVEKLSEKSSPFFYKVGIHPRTICKELQEKRKLPDNIKRGLEKHMKEKKCLGIGEIGLDGKNTWEEDILVEQLKWCRDYLPENKRIGIHTPRNNKYNITQITLNILEEYNNLKDKIVIDHVELSSIELLRKAPFYIGITLQKGKSSAEDVIKIIKNNLYPEHKILLNSDSGRNISLPYMEFVTGTFLEKDIKRKLLKDNLMCFYGINF